MPPTGSPAIFSAKDAIIAENFIFRRYNLNVKERDRLILQTAGIYSNTARKVPD